MAVPTTQLLQEVILYRPSVQLVVDVKMITYQHKLLQN